MPLPPWQYSLEDYWKTEIVGQISEVELVGNAEVQQISEHGDDAAEPGEPSQDPEEDHDSVHVKYALYLWRPFSLID